MSDSADRRMVRIRQDMVWMHPFWGYQALDMKLMRDDDGVITTTMATDGANHYWHPPFIADMPDPEVEGVDVHELMHKLNMHHLRMGDRDPRLWNVACDYSINPAILKAGFKLPKDALVSAEFEGMDAEQIYEVLHNRSTIIYVDVPWGKVMKPTKDDGSPLDQAELDAEEINIRLSIAEAAKLVGPGGYGSAAAMIERLVEKAKQETVDWRNVIRAFVSKHGAITNTTWRRPGRRGLAAGITMPSPVREATPEIAVLVDTSGSINRKALGQFAAEIDAINREVMPERITFGYGGTKLIGVQTLEQFDDVPTNLKGGGGTDLQHMVDEMVESAPNAKMLVVLTDLLCTGMNNAPGVPVLWVVWGDKWSAFVRHATYGEIVPMGREGA
jgi:predicted metal-dependent peptidase